MSENSNIEWTDHTFNGWIGCKKVSPGCANCYAEELDRRRFSKTLPGGSHWGAGAPRHRTSAANWRQPLKWNQLLHNPYKGEDSALGKGPGEPHPFICHDCGTRYLCESGGHPHCHFECKIVPFRPRVFCSSLADWLDDEVPIEWLADLLRLIHQTPNLDWLLLTKRPQNFYGRLRDALLHFGPSDPVCLWLTKWISFKFQYAKVPENVWIGTTVEDQTRAEERIPALLKIPAKVRFLSCEPLLAKLDLSEWLNIEPDRDGSWRRQSRYDLPREIHWVICGGESGPKARPIHPDWARGLRDQCAAAGVSYFMKQWGEWAPGSNFPEFIPSGRAHNFGDESLPDDAMVWRVGKKAAGRLLDGVLHDGFPAVKGGAL